MTVRCAHVAFSTLEPLREFPGLVGWPPDNIFLIGRANAERDIYTRRCGIQIGPKHRTGYDFEALVQQCQDAIQTLPPEGVMKTITDQGGTAIISAVPVEKSSVDGASEVPVYAKCRHNGVMPHLHFEVWFLMYPET